MVSSNIIIIKVRITYIFLYYRVWPRSTDYYACDDSIIDKKRKRHKTETMTGSSKEETVVNSFNHIQNYNSSENETFSSTLEQTLPTQTNVTENIEENEVTIVPSNNNSHHSRTTLNSFKVINSIGSLMDSLKSTTITPNNEYCVNKTKRKRVRKHKRSSRVSSATTVNECSPVINVTMDETVTADTVKVMNKNNKNLPTHLKFTENESIAVKPLALSDIKQIPVYNYCALKDEDFLKYPLMDSIFPRRDDVISFKVSILFILTFITNISL